MIPYDCETIIWVLLKNTYVRLYNIYNIYIILYIVTQLICDTLFYFFSKDKYLLNGLKIIT